MSAHDTPAAMGYEAPPPFPPKPGDDQRAASGRATAPLGLLRDRASDIYARAANAEKLATEAWNDYLRRSHSARALWRDHGELLSAIQTLEEDQRV